MQFALGLDEFNLTKHQPHPPGYPLFILAGHLLHHGLGLSHVNALTLIAALGGALFVTAWYLLARDVFSEAFARLLAATLAVTPIVWMSSTKALTDAPAAALLAVEAWAAWRYTLHRSRKTLLVTALAAAVATGLRPQLFPVAAVLLAIPLARGRATRRSWLYGFAVFLAGCLLWLVPTAWSQARLSVPADTWAYPKQLLQQWRWRLDKPEVFMTAGPTDSARLRGRLSQHVGGWFRNGLGLQTPGVRRGGRVLVFAGLALYLVHVARRRERHRAFWVAQWPWALTLVAIIFFSLPADTRYYLAIMPLLWIAILRGWWLLQRPWRLIAISYPALMLSLSIPLAWAGRTIPPPPIQMVQYLEAKFAAKERSHVWLLCGDSLRQARWYGKEFEVSVARPYGIDRQGLASAIGVYTDTATLPLRGNLSGTKLVLEQTFTRSPLVYPKHARVDLYRVLRPGEGDVTSR